MLTMNAIIEYAKEHNYTISVLDDLKEEKKDEKQE